LLLQKYVVAGSKKGNKPATTTYRFKLGE
jgi:hypothetical protein